MNVYVNFFFNKTIGGSIVISPKFTQEQECGLTTVLNGILPISSHITGMPVVI